MEGKSPGRFDQGVWGLDLKLVGLHRIQLAGAAQFGFIVRGDMRDAMVTLGTDRLYLTKQRRVTAGFRVVINPHTVVKLEYLHNDEYGGITEFDNDVVTSSLVLAF